MSILIKGMEMPTSCAKCKLFGEYGCAFIGAVGYALTEGRRSKDCPLVPVPPHGRLIDADEADSRFTPNYTELSDFQCGWNAAMKRVCKDAPAIIPADEGEK